MIAVAGGTFLPRSQVAYVVVGMPNLDANSARSATPRCSRTERKRLANSVSGSFSSLAKQSPYKTVYFSMKTIDCFIPFYRRKYPTDIAHITPSKNGCSSIR